MSTTICEFINVEKHYSSHIVLDRLSLRIAPGEMVSIVGKSGSGKTTVLNLMGLLEKLTEERYNCLGKRSRKLV